MPIKCGQTQGRILRNVYGLCNAAAVSKRGLMLLNIRLLKGSSSYFLIDCKISGEMIALVISLAQFS